MYIYFRLGHQLMKLIFIHKIKLLNICKLIFKLILKLLLKIIGSDEIIWLRC